jgi:FkbM family methyltransferase
MFYSQFGEDRLLALHFKDTTPGLCVEVGANDGVNDSTTYHFEVSGWECVLVEPNPALCEMISSTRRGRLFECAASSQAGTAVLNIAVGPARAHGVSGLGPDQAAKQRIESLGFSMKTLQVPIRTLDDMLEEVSSKRPLKFVTIDVEGHELDVLKGFSIERWRPEILILEDNANFQDPAVRTYLRRFGYVPFRRTGVNDWYAPLTDTALASRKNRLLWQRARALQGARRAVKQRPMLLRVLKKLRSLATARS